MASHGSANCRRTNLIRGSGLLILLLANSCSSGSSPGARAPAPHSAIVTASSATVTPVSLTSTKSSVLLFTVSAVPQVQAVSGVAEGTAFLQWLNSGTRVVGYSWSDHAYEILGLDGGSADRIYTFFAPQPAQDAHRRAEWAQALPGGKTILLQSDDGPPRIYDVASGAFHPFLGPLGQNVVFTGTTDGVQLIFNNIVDGRSKVMTSDLNGGNARVLAENQPGSVGMIDEHASSPDGNYLLLSSSDTAGGETQWKDIVTSKSGDRVWQIAIPGIALWLPSLM